MADAKFGGPVPKLETDDANGGIRVANHSFSRFQDPDGGPGGEFRDAKSGRSDAKYRVLEARTGMGAAKLQRYAAESSQYATDEGEFASPVEV
jgi:hypothetical protein